MSRAIIYVPAMVGTAFLLVACGGGGGGGGPPVPPAPPTPALFNDVSSSSLPVGALQGMCMDVDNGDVDGDGDIDLVLAQEFSNNLLLLNDGVGRFSVAANAFAGSNGDNEDLRLGDFNGDGRPDVISVHEDDGQHVLQLNAGMNTFTDASSLVPVMSTANAVEVIDFDGDGRLDIAIGNEGANLILMQQADGSFVNDTARLPNIAGVTQDLLLVDIDQDGDTDIFAANEGENFLLINDGSGFFTNASSAQLPPGGQESREADAADVDNDGDLDIIVANVAFNLNLPVQNQLLLNDGSGVFTDATASNLVGVANASSSFTIKFIDLDGDGDVDILTPRNSFASGGALDAWENDGSGVFTGATQNVFSPAPSGSLFDIEVADFDGEGNLDIYLCYRTGTDQLYIRQ